MIRPAQASDAPQLLSLMRELALVRWQVLPDNEPAKRFYRQQRAAMDADWENWFINLGMMG